jgi:hypothetical protein
VAQKDDHTLILTKRIFQSLTQRVKNMKKSMFSTTKNYLKWKTTPAGLPISAEKGRSLKLYNE